MPKQDNRSAPSDATLADALADAFAEEFEEFADSQFTRKVVRASIAGKVKRRDLLRLGFAQGCKTGNTGAGLIHRAQLALALGLSPELPEWPALMGAVRDLVKRDGEASS